MNPEDRLPGTCGINGCPAQKIQLSTGIWVCPVYYGSAMHGSSLMRFDTQEEIDDDLERYAGCSVEEYKKQTGNPHGSSKALVPRGLCT